MTALREPRPAEPLPEQLRTLAAEVEAAGLPTSVDVEGDERRLEDDAQVALYRAAQEGLTNVRKHANAHAAMIRLAYLPDSCAWRFATTDAASDGGGDDGTTAAGSASSAFASASIDSAAPSPSSRHRAPA